VPANAPGGEVDDDEPRLPIGCYERHEVLVERAPERLRRERQSSGGDQEVAPIHEVSTSQSPPAVPGREAEKGAGPAPPGA
jgi:hypothetical protein